MLIRYLGYQSTKTIRFLTPSQVQRLHARFVVPNAVPTSPGLLESAVHSPMNMKHYAKEEDVFQLAANLAEKVMKNHAFQDGNKRTALLAADMFLKINGYYLQKVPFAEDTNNMGLANAHVAVVTNQWTAEQLGNYYKSVAAPLVPMTAEVMEYRSSATEY
ncbi:DOC family protein [Aspergillus falconensis]